MRYIEEKRDLFSVSSDHVLVHCISSDFAMGAGIATKFANMGVKNILLSNYSSKWENEGYCIPIGLKDQIVCNLVTKEKYWHKPTYKSLTESLQSLKTWIVQENNSTLVTNLKIAMPLIGCGLDRLEWNKVSDIIKDVFNDTDIEILVCRL